MKYTREQLQGMRNYEIAEALCGLLGYETIFVHPHHETEMPTLNVYEKTTGRFFAFEAGRWDDIMPLAVEHGISLCPSEDKKDCEWYADKIFSRNLESCWSDVSPQRAIACCLILVLQEGKE